MKFVIATHNVHKLDELRRILAPLGVEADIDENLPEAEETGVTFAENAFIKARGKGIIKIAGRDNEEFGRVEIDCEKFTEYSFPIKKVLGVQPIWIAFEGKGMELHSFGFRK